ncbi:hypothetical protein EIP86_004211 [Pleurotus ostreatoroseus]|nr:hypothetical protein EIP86_004211 [Pleurotus ostreatoroseus]
MSTQRATIAYTASPAFLTTDHWKQIYAALQSQLPLRNLHWKSVSRPTLRTIQELPVNFVSAESIRSEHTSQVPQTLLERPLLSAYIVVCEDADTYKNTVKKQIKDWHTSVTQKKNQEWLIIHIVRPDSVSNTARLFQMKASVLDKIRADFNVDKRDRQVSSCVQLVWSSDHDNPTAWADLIGRIKEGILSAFEAAVAQREDEVKRSEGQRQMPGWNFCTYFILKESLASSFEGMSLHEEALDTYEELESVFFQVLKEKNMTWFGALIAPSARDDSAPLLSISKKPYRDLILANSISIFDFRIYLLARQCTLLSHLGRLGDVGHKTVTFLRSFGRRLQEMEDELPPYFIESWTYSSALSVVEHIETWAKRMGLSKSAASNVNAVKGELVELARNQLDILGIDMEFLPAQPPFSNALSSGQKRREKAALDRISKQDLKAALEDKNAFFEMYITLTKRAIELYANAGRRKFALRMHGSLAALDVVRGQLASALQTYTSLPAHYSPHSWTSLEAFMLTQALDLHAQSGKPRDRDWILILLEFLKAYVQDMGKSLLTAKEDHVAYASSLVDVLRDAAQALPNDLNHLDHPAITVSIPNGSAKLAETRDGAYIDVTVNNMLPCTLPVDAVVVVISGRENNSLTFSNTVDSLPSGPNILQVFCSSASAGIYQLHSSQVKIAKLNLQWNHIPQTTGKNPKPSRPQTLVHVPKDSHALNVDLRQPQRIERGVDKQPEIVVVLSSGRNTVSKAMLRMSPPAGVRFLVDEVHLESEDHNPPEVIDGALVFFNLQAETTLSLSVPHTDASSSPSMRVGVVVDYVTESEPAITRTIRLTRMISTSLPISINIEDFFRGTRLFTRFTLSTTSYQFVRIRKTELVSSDGDGSVKIRKGSLTNRGIVTVTPAQPGQFLFQIDSQKDQEIESFVDYAVKTALGQESSHALDPASLVERLVQALSSDSSWVELYIITGELVIPRVISDDKESQEAISRAIEILRQGRPEEVDESGWREYVISVDIPQVHILAAVRLQIMPNPFLADGDSRKLPPLYAGQPIAATLSVTTSFHWAPSEDSHNKSYLMRFDVEMTKNWLVSGRKRGDFVARDGETFGTSITLIALHHGELPLPRIAVGALPLLGEVKMGSAIVPICETHQVHGAEKVLVLPRGGRTTFVVGMGESDRY